MSSTSKKSIRRYGQSAIEDELRKLTKATHHQNNQLNQSAFVIGQILAGASTHGVEIESREDAESRLFQAASDNGYVSRDGKQATTATIKSGLNAGLANPRKFPHIGFASNDAGISCVGGAGQENSGLSDQEKPEIPQRIWANAVPVLGSPAEVYLNSRGIPTDRLPSGALDNLRYHPSCAIFKGKHHEERRPAFIALVRNTLTGEPTGAIHRTFLTSDGSGKCEDINHPKKALGKYGANGAVIFGNIEPGVTVAETEGIEDALSIVAATGGSAIATLNVDRLGKVCLPADVKRTICGDAKTEKDKLKARAGASAAADRDFQEVRLCFPPNGVGDFNELLEAQGIGAVAVAISSAETIGPDLSDLKFEDDLSLATQSDQIVKGIFGHGDIGMLCGQAMSGKTFVAYDLAAHIAQGRDWHGRKVRQRSVLIVNYEGNRSFDNRRLAYRQEHGSCGRNIAEVAIPAPLGKTDGNVGVDVIVKVAKKLAAISGHNVGLIVLDTWSRASAGYDENSNSDMNQFIAERIEAIARETGAAVLGVHHPGKVPDRGVRGASSQFAALDFVIMIRGGEGAGNPRDALLDKLKDGEIGPLFTYRLKQVCLGTDDDGEELTSCVVDVHEGGATTHSRSRRRAPKGQAAKALQEFDELVIAGNVRPVPANERIPDGAIVVSVSDWQAACLKKGLVVSAQENPDKREKTCKRAFKRAVGKLEESGHIAVFDQVAWRPDQVGRGQTQNSDFDPEARRQGQSGSNRKAEENQRGAKKGQAGSNHEMDSMGSRGQRGQNPLGSDPLDPALDPDGNRHLATAHRGEHKANSDRAAEEIEIEIEL